MMRVALLLLIASASCGKPQGPAPRADPPPPPEAAAREAPTRPTPVSPTVEPRPVRGPEQSITGIGIRPILQKGGFAIGQVFPGGPADQAGLRVGDLVVRVDGQSTARWTLNKVAKTLRGVEGTRVKLEYARASSAPRAVVIVRRQVRVIAIPNQR